MKASKSSIGRTVDQPDAAVRFYLFLGPDEAQSRALANRLLQALSAAKFVLAAAAAKANPALVADEAAALSLFGERRLIWIEPAGNEIAEAIEGLLSAASVESPVVALAGSLPKSSPLLKLADSSPVALSFTAYAPEGEEAARLVADLGRRVGLKISLPLAAQIAEASANDQAVAAQELEKLALYAGASPHSPKELDHEALDAVGAATGEGDFLKLADLALLGDLPGVGGLVSRLPASGSEPIMTVRSLQRRLLFLAPARARMERGESLGAVMTSFGKALFWKDKSAVEKMLKQWTAADLATIAQRTGLLERSLMFSKAPQREALGEELLTIARKARSAK